MVRQRLPPSMQDHGRADLRTQVLVVGGDRSQRLGCRLEQDGVDHRLIVIGDGRNRSRQREYDVEIGDRQQIGLAGREPLTRGAGLTLGAMPVAATIVGDLRISKRSAHPIWFNVAQATRLPARCTW
jgi:hypothetical protein